MSGYYSYGEIDLIQSSPLKKYDLERLNALFNITQSLAHPEFPFPRAGPFLSHGIFFLSPFMLPRSGDPVIYRQYIKIFPKRIQDSKKYI